MSTPAHTRAPLPSAEELVRLGFSFEQVSLHSLSPVRLRKDGIAAAVFPCREDAGRIVHMLSKEAD